MRAMMILALMVGFALAVAPVLAAEPSATISIEVKAVEVGLGASWGQGVVTYGPRTYAFKVRGLKVLGVGITKLDAQGSVYNLKAIDYLEGTYRKAQMAEVTFIKKEDMGLVVKNEKGVVLNLKAVQKGLELDLVSEGLTVLKLK